MSLQRIESFPSQSLESLIGNFSELTPINGYENSGMTARQVYEAKYLGQSVIVKLSKQGQEAREIGLSGDSLLQAWCPDKLRNEYEALLLINSGSYTISLSCEIQFPQPVYYRQDPTTGMELSAQSKLFGRRLDRLAAEEQADPSMGYRIGRVIGRFNNLKVPPVMQFGSCAGGIKFDSWLDFYSHMIKVGLSIYTQREIFNKMQKLRGFSNLASSYENWLAFCGNIQELYFNDHNQDLISDDGRKTLCHGDIWQGHFIVISDQTTGLFDFDRAFIGGESYDLAIYKASGIDDLNMDDASFDRYFEKVLRGYTEHTEIHPQFEELASLYGLWWWIETLHFDAMNGYDRSIRAVSKIRNDLQPEQAEKHR